MLLSVDRFMHIQAKQQNVQNVNSKEQVQIQSSQNVKQIFQTKKCLNFLFKAVICGMEVLFKYVINI